MESHSALATECEHACKLGCEGIVSKRADLSLRPVARLDEDEGASGDRGTKGLVRELEQVGDVRLPAVEMEAISPFEQRGLAILGGPPEHPRGGRRVRRAYARPGVGEAWG